MTGAPRPKRVRAQRWGHYAEMLAALYLRAKGYRILTRRWRCPAGEVDIIAWKGGILIGVEVKARRTDRDDAINAVTPRTRQRIERAMDFYMARHGSFENASLRFDIIAMIGWRPHHLPDAWRPWD